MSFANLLQATASLIAFGGLLLHVLRGLPFIVRPMLKSDLHFVLKHTLAFSWHWGTVTMIMLTVCFAAPLVSAAFRDLAWVAVFYSATLGGLSFWTMKRHGFRIGQMPQWIVFGAASVASTIALVLG